jgi:hypothetical protein
MKSFFQINSPTGHVYELPVSVVAEHRANTMLELHSDEFATLEEAMADTSELFKDDLFSIKDWCQNNMNWSDLEQHSRLIRFTPPDTAWPEGEWTYHGYRAVVGELDGAAIMKSPVEFVATVMAEAQQLCNVTVLNDQAGNPFGAIVVIVGAPPVIGAYIKALQITGDHITAAPAGAPTH